MEAFVFLETFPDFLNYCRSLRGEILHTETRNKPFSVVVEGGMLWFVPLSSGKRRRADPEKTQRVLSLLKNTGSNSPGYYQAITFHASYILAVANKHMEGAS
jgi:hypothetical protein